MSGVLGEAVAQSGNGKARFSGETAMNTAYNAAGSPIKGKKIIKRIAQVALASMILASANGTTTIAVDGTAAWPVRPVKIIVPIGAGSAPDAAARLVADGLRQRWGQPVVIENRPGADASVGTGAFANANDDHTLLYGFASALTVNPLIQEKVPFDPARDLVPISAVTNTIIAVAVHRDLPVHSLADLARIAEARPGKILWGAGPSLPRFLFAAFLKQRNLDMPFVPYRDAAASPIDLAEGRVQLLITSLQATVTPVQSGKARVIAIANTRRVATLPDVQTAIEAGYPEMSIDGLIGLFGWRGMPTRLRDRISTDVVEVLKDPEKRARIEASGQLVLGGTPEEFAEAIEQQRTRIGEIAALIDFKTMK
jgi:tripartite-type tricarboxylate transporter receptor subunit TctC